MQRKRESCEREALNDSLPYRPRLGIKLQPFSVQGCSDRPIPAGPPMIFQLPPLLCPVVFGGLGLGLSDWGAAQKPKEEP